MLAESNIATIGMAGSASEVFRGILPLRCLVCWWWPSCICFWCLPAAADPCRGRPGLVASLVYLGTLASVAVLGITSFVAVIRFGTLGGWWLFIHMFGAGVFTFVLPVLALTWCEANRFGRPPQPAGSEGQVPPSRFLRLAKSMFWVILVAGLIVIGTMILSMLPVFGTDCLQLLLDIHRYAGLVVVAATVLHLYAALLPRIGVS